MYSIHATRKLLDRVKQPVAAPVEHPATVLGNWYATALFWKPQVALFVNERTLLPVFVPLAPAAKLARRFPDQLGRVLEGIGTPIDFVLQEIGAMGHASYSKTVNRSVVGSMNDFAFLAEAGRAHGKGEDLVALSVHLSGTPCSPLRKSHGFPDREVEALVAEALAP
ncbi:MAG: hypothetical protein GY926_12570 [bacterium]|nr:hypothetical protein [bacterium]